MIHIKKGVNNDLSVNDAALAMGVSPQFIRVGLQQQRLPFGVAVKMSNSWSYHLSRKKLEEYLGKEKVACIKKERLTPGSN